MNRDETNKRRMILNGVLITLGLAVCFWLSYLLCSRIFYYIGTPPAPWVSILIGVLGVYIFMLTAKVIAESHNKKHGTFGDYRHILLDETLDALNRISKGDFSVIVETREHDPLSELAESVNKMARELGSMENLRQDFISNVSHEIQSPLTSISGYASLLKNNELACEQRVHYIDVIETEAKRLSQLSNNLLKLSSLESNAQPLTLTEFRVDKQIQNAALVLEPQWAMKQLNLSLHLDKTNIIGDENLLTQVWVNLLHNAIKFTPEHGNIEISLTKKNDEVIICIADTGIGISGEDKPHVFERFYKADKSRNRALGGNGLGLSLVRKIVELHGGTITVESTLGLGTSFVIKLPKE